MKTLTLPLIIFMSLASAWAQDTLLERMHVPHRIAAHRGGMFSKQGNTLKQFQIALSEGADIIETDLRVTRDGVVVVFHDFHLNKSTNCFGLLSWYSLEQLSSCRTKKTNQPIPTFEEVLQWSVGKVIVNAEFKSSKAIPGALKLMKKYEAQEWVYFQTQEKQSNYHSARKIDPKVHLIYLAKTEEQLDWALSQNDPYLFAIELSPREATQDQMDRIHQAGKLASANAFPMIKDGEESGVAGCLGLMQKGFDILVTDQTVDCKKQRESFP